jgi:hypothetical protein
MTDPSSPYIPSRCQPCAVGYPELTDWDCATEPNPEHGPVEVALAYALADAGRVGCDPFRSEQERAQLAVVFLECDTSGIVSDLGSHAQWSVVFDEDREGATINGVSFYMNYDMDGNSNLEPRPPARTCPECDEDAGWHDVTNVVGAQVDLECLGCGEVITVAQWWPRAPDNAPSLPSGDA